MQKVLNQVLVDPEVISRSHLVCLARVDPDLEAYPLRSRLTTRLKVDAYLGFLGLLET